MSANLYESGSQSYHLTLLKELSVVTDLDLLKLSSCKDNLERFTVAYALPFVNKCRIAAVEKKYRPKSLTVARNARLRGNQAFQKKNFTEALKLYSAAAISAPHGDDGELEYALALANRSAALMTLENYGSAIEDIEEALSNGYPEDLHHKLLERQVKCLLQTNKPLEAVKICRLALEKSDVLQQKKIEASFKQLLSKAEAILSDNCFQDGKESGTDSEHRCLMVVGGSNPMLPAASNKITIEESMEAGRYVVAASHLEVGDVLVVEKAYASVMRPDKYDTHCHHCYRSLKVPVPCLTCSRILFCSRTCRQAALLQYHSTECSVIDFLASTGFGIITTLALRILTIKPVEFYLQFKTLLDDPNHLKREDWSDEHKEYLRTYNLLTHTGIRTIESLFDSCVQAIILLKCLRLAGYFGTEITNHGLSLSEQELWIGSLLLRHIHLLEVNGHEICEVEANTSPFVEPVGIGAALYLTTALFNHSCDPSVTRHRICFLRPIASIVRTIRSISKGETVEDNYGPFFTRTIKEKRQKVLKDRYFFLCMCPPCVENWPLYNQMTDLDLRFRCSEPNCGKPLMFNKKMSILDIALCPHCNTVNDMANNLQHVNDAKSALDLANSLAGRGQYDNAIDLFQKSLLQFENVLHPPHKYYLECQEGIRKCFWMFGNVRPLSTTVI